MTVQMSIATANSHQFEARGARRRNVTGQLDSNSVQGQAVQLALASNTTKINIIERSMGQLSAARSDLLLLEEMINDMQGLIKRQLQLAADQLKEFEINGAENAAITAEYDSISDSRDAMVKNLVTKVDGLVTTPFGKDVDITLYDGTHINFTGKPFSLILVYSAIPGLDAYVNLDRIVNGGIKAV